MSKKSAEGAVRDGLRGLYPRLWRFCVVLTKDREQAQDLAQAACERALASAHQFTPGTHLDRWVFTIARRLWLNEKRSEQVRLPLHASCDVEPIDPSPTAETNIFARDVFGLIQALPEGQRLCVLFVYIEGHSYREAADMLDIPIGTVMSRLATARKTIATQTQGDVA